MRALALRFLAVVALALSSLALAQDDVNTSDGDGPAVVPLAELAWLEGHWQASAFGGKVEEVWLPAMGDSMQAIFRAVSEDALQFSEFIQVTSEAAGILMRFYHFRSDYSTWESGGPPMELLLKSADSKELVFEAHNKVSPDRIVYRRVGDELHVTVTGLDGALVFHRVE